MFAFAGRAVERQKQTIGLTGFVQNHDAETFYTGLGMLPSNPRPSTVPTWVVRDYTAASAEIFQRAGQSLSY